MVKIGQNVGKKITKGYTRPEGAGNFDNMDDYNIVDSIDVNHGRVQDVPAVAKDIVNKEYVDSEITDLTTTYLDYHPHQDVNITASPSFEELTITDGTQNYIIDGTTTANNYAFQVTGQTSGQGAIFALCSKDQDGTDASSFRLYSIGNVDARDRQWLDFRWHSGNGYYWMFTNNAGAGTAHKELHFSADIAYPNQLVLKTDGSVGMSGAVDIDGNLDVDATDIDLTASNDVDLVAMNGNITLQGEGSTICSSDFYFYGSGKGLPYGCIDGMDETVTCTTQNTWYQVTFDTAGASNNTTVSTANNDITIIKTGDYKVNVTACIHTANAQDIEILAKTENGTVDLKAHIFQTTGVAGKIENSAASTISPITATDTLELWVRCTSAGTVDVIFDHVDLNCIQVGG